ncbi:unnamed protein product [Effrenium voratum]|nr:unnamed protein product [Effrenium voratum]
MFVILAFLATAAAYPANLNCDFACMGNYMPGSSFGYMGVANVGNETGTNCVVTTDIPSSGPMAGENYTVTVTSTTKLAQKVVASSGNFGSDGMVSNAVGQGVLDPGCVYREPPLLPDFPGLGGSRSAANSAASRAPSAGSERSDLPVIRRRGDGFVQGAEAQTLLERSRLPPQALAKCWELADQDRDGRLTFSEFLCLVHLVTCLLRGAPVAELERPGGLPAPLQAALARLEPLEQLAREREESRSRSASPAPTAIGLDALGADGGHGRSLPQVSLTPEPEPRNLDDGGFGGLADLGNDAAASKFEDFGQFETEGFGEFPEKEKKEKKKKKKDKAKDKLDFDTDVQADFPGGDWREPSAEKDLDPFSTAADFPATAKADFGDFGGMDFGGLGGGDFGFGEMAEMGFAGLESQDMQPENVKHLNSVAKCDRSLAKMLRDEVDQLDGELRRLQELGASLEQKLSQEAVDLEQLARQKKAMEKGLLEEKQRLSQLRDSRGQAHLESLALRRDRSHLTQELGFLRTMAEGEEELISVLRHSNQYLEASCQDLEQGAEALTRRGAELQATLKTEEDLCQRDTRTLADLRATFAQVAATPAPVADAFARESLAMPSGKGQTPPSGPIAVPKSSSRFVVQREGV